MRHLARKKPRVVLIGERDDAHLPYVEKYLAQPLIVVDQAATAGGEELSYSLTGNKLRIEHKGESLDDVTGVWVRGLRTSVAIKVPVAPQYEEYCRSALTRHADALYTQLPGAIWVSDFFAIRRADYKPLQLQVAARLGLNVPDTLFTSSPRRAREFVDKHSATIVKPVTGAPLIRNEKTGVGFYATKLHSGEQVNLEGLHLAPAIFQKAIDPAADLRVVVVGGKVFAAIIVDHKAGERGRTRDWRIGAAHKSLSIDPYELPADLAEKSVRLVKELGLNYGAIDFVLDTKGKIWFLENNATGQWAFIEEETKQPISRTMAELLEAGK